MSRVIKAYLVVNDTKKQLLRTSDKTEWKKEVHEQEQAKEQEGLTKEKADLIYQETKTAIEEMMASAHQEADSQLMRAKEKAQLILEECQKEIATLEEQHRQLGFKEGYTEGKKEADKEFNEAYEKIKELIKGICNEREKIQKRYERDIVELIMLMTEKVIGSVIEIKPEIINQIINNSLEKVKESETIVVRLNPIHIPYLNIDSEQCLDRFQGRLQIVEDIEIEPGDCQVITDTGFLDSRINEQITLLKQSMLEVIDNA